MTKKKNQKDVMLTEHFALSEFTRSVTGELLGIDNSPNAEQIDNMKGLCEKVLEPLRLRLGHAVRITPGFRCKFLNRYLVENLLHRSVWRFGSKHRLRKVFGSSAAILM